MEVPAVGLVDGPPVLDPLRDHEARVQDRHREHDQREEQGDDRVRLQRAQDGHGGEQVAEQVGAGVPHEARGGREAVPQEAQRAARGERREHRRPGAVERQRDHRQGRGRDHADARREPVDPVDEVDHVHHRHEPEHREDVAERRRCRAAARREEHIVRSTPPTNGRVKSSTLTPLKTGIIAATVWPSELQRRRGGRRRRRARRPRRSPRRRRGSPGSGGAQGRKRTPATARRTRIARPPSFGVGTVVEAALVADVDRARSAARAAR